MCSVKALTQRVTAIMKNGGTEHTLLCAYWGNQEWENIIPDDIRLAIKVAVVPTRLD